jgi:hypothetical protein
VYYAAYEGNRESLFPATNGVVDLADNTRRDLRGLLCTTQMKTVANVEQSKCCERRSTSVASVIRTQAKRQVAMMRLCHCLGGRTGLPAKAIRPWWSRTCARS